MKGAGEKGARLRTWHEGRESLREDFCAVRDPLIINQIPFKKRQRIIEEKTCSASCRRKKKCEGELHGVLRKMSCVTVLVPATQLLQASVEQSLLSLLLLFVVSSGSDENLVSKLTESITYNFLSSSSLCLTLRRTKEGLSFWFSNGVSWQNIFAASKFFVRKLDLNFELE